MMQITIVGTSRYLGLSKKKAAKDDVYAGCSTVVMVILAKINPVTIYLVNQCEALKFELSNIFVVILE
jgi:hypothetical protein